MPGVAPAPSAPRLAAGPARAALLLGAGLLGAGLLGAALLGQIGCATPTSPTAPKDSATSAEPGATSAASATSEPSVLSGDDPARARFVAACTSACERGSAMRAVGWQVIQAECARGCEDDWAAPLVTTTAEAAAAKDQRVRIAGELRAPSGPDARTWTVVLRDGAELTVRLEGSRLGGTAAPAGRVLLVGTLEGSGAALQLAYPTAVVAE